MLTYLAVFGEVFSLIILISSGHSFVKSISMSLSSHFAKKDWISVSNWVASWFSSYPLKNAMLSPFRWASPFFPKNLKLGTIYFPSGWRFSRTGENSDRSIKLSWRGSSFWPDIMLLTNGEALGWHTSPSSSMRSKWFLEWIWVTLGMTCSNLPLISADTSILISLF